ncbi:hypothetical protein HYQ45_014616 [Verticillium longisporum]|uniref:Uncharacterized protein n=1 Tax=Verticillium longisporum TaxID=100787 RepID=A0A8I2Z7S1_VERLO|nr:hypothetical protein HYQ45_014616 [Verticillium longisporum]
MTSFTDLVRELSHIRSPVDAASALRRDLEHRARVGDDQEALNEVCVFAGRTLEGVSAKIAQGILDTNVRHTVNRQDSILTSILEDVLRPLFSRSKSARITTTGRKSQYPWQAQQNEAVFNKDDTADTTAWKSAHPWALSVYSWTVANSEEFFIGKKWPLYTPVLLALLDDPEARIKARGLQISRVFVQKCSPSLLYDTGLGDIMEQSITPILSYLPSLTPEDESVLLLEAAYPAVIELARRYAKDPQFVPSAQRIRARLMREVCGGYMHASQFLLVTDVLLRHLGTLVHDSGFAASPYLKDIIPIFTETLRDPFIGHSPARLSTTLDGLALIVRVCWPRVSTSAYESEIIRALAVCWLSLYDDSGDGSHRELLDKLRYTVEVLSAAVEATGTRLELKVAPLVAKDEVLGGLFDSRAKQIKIFLVATSWIFAYAQKLGIDGGVIFRSCLQMTLKMPAPVNVISSFASIWLTEGFKD